MCGDAAVGIQTCQANQTLTACNCGAAGTAGTEANGGTLDGGGPGGGGKTGGSGTSGGTGASTGDDAGTVEPMLNDAGMPVTKPVKAATDGTQGAACTDSTDCTDSRKCYNASGATPVGYCTSTCTDDSDCTGLGDSFACSTATLGATTRYCRQSCSGTDDQTCPKLMSCTAVTGGFRCLYDAKDIGSGTGKAYDECLGSGDCSGSLVCYASGVVLNIGGMSYRGFCTQTCRSDNDCSENPATGEAAPTCDNDGTCGLGCTSLLGLGAPACPDEMKCISSGLLAQHCLYLKKASGGI
jgi:hypothetical protein